MFASLLQLEKKPVAVFSSDDTGAPVLTKQAGSLKSLLKACLVTGYGTKTALGWSMPFESGDLLSAAFKSTDPTASQFFLKINNSSTADASMSVYQEMTNIDTGAKPIVVDQKYYITTGRWRLIGHSKAFILLIEMTTAGGTKISHPLIFGDLPREIKRVEPVCVFWCGRNSASWYQVGGAELVLFKHVNGNSTTTTSDQAGDSYAQCYPFVVNNGDGGTNLTMSNCKFEQNEQRAGAVLHEPVLTCLPDKTWSMLPMLQPVSHVHYISNFDEIPDGKLGVVTGVYDNNYALNSSIVPTDFWWA